MPFSISDEKVPTVSSKSRSTPYPTPPHATTSDVLNAQVDLLWRLAISKGTASAYNSALQAFHTFIKFYQPYAPIGQLPDISEDLIIKFVTHCSQNLNLKWSTIKLYVSGLRFHYIKAVMYGQVTLWTGYITSCLPYVGNKVMQHHPTGIPSRFRFCTACAVY